MREKELTFSSEVGGGVLDSSLNYDTVTGHTHARTHTSTHRMTARIITTGRLGTVKGKSFLLDCRIKY